MMNDDPTNEPPGRGGGPPGGSAFTRDGKVRQPTSRRLIPNDAAFTRVDQTSTSTPSNPMPPTPAPVPPIPTERSFPGGHVTLPQISGTPSRTLFVSGVAFRRGQAPGSDPDTDAARSGFSEYFPTDSLFAPPEAETGATAEVPADVARACAELRVRPDTPWPDVVARHRALVKEFHPDSFTENDKASHELAEIEIRRINQAYDVLRRRPLQPPDGPPGRSSRPPSGP